MKEIPFLSAENYQTDFIGEVLAPNAELVGKYGFPKLKAENYIPTGVVLPFNYLMSTVSERKGWYHCFIGDSGFERLWKGFPYYLPYLLEADGLTGTDFSIFRNYSEELQVRNCYRNRVLTYAMQEAGVKVIPTAGFGGEKTWEWCFDGLPRHSSVAITTNGTLSDPEACRLRVGGIDAMVHTICPTAIIVCGNYPKWLDTKYPEIQIVPIQSYSQMRHKRERGCA